MRTHPKLLAKWTTIGNMNGEPINTNSKTFKKTYGIKKKHLKKKWYKKLIKKYKTNPTL